MRESPPLELLNYIFRYAPHDGKLYWGIDRASNARKGQEVGGIDGKGYRYARVNKVGYRVHRLIWKIITGCEAIGEIDHINGDTLDNRFENLREISHSENMKNCKRRKDNTSGMTGVSWRPQRNVWRAYVNNNGKMKELGAFKDKQDAINCREEYSKKLNFHMNHGRIENV